MGGGHDDDAAPLAPPTWYGRAVALLAEAMVLLACVVALCDVLWLGHRLLPWSSAIACALALLLLAVRKRPGLAAACLVGLLAVGWPWLRAAWDPHAPTLPDGAAWDQRVLAIDLRGFDGDPAVAVAELIAADATIVAALCDPEGELGDVLESAEGYRWERDEYLRAGRGEARREVVRLVVLARTAPTAAVFHVDGGSDGLIIELRHGEPDGNGAARTLIAAFGAGSHPRRFVRQAPIIERLGELAAEPGPVVVVAPAAWVRAAPRWRAIAAATGAALPARGMPATHPRWLPRPFATAGSAVAVRGLALRPGALEVSGAPRRAVVVEVGPAPDQSR